MLFVWNKLTIVVSVGVTLSCDGASSISMVPSPLAAIEIVSAIVVVRYSRTTRTTFSAAAPDVDTGKPASRPSASNQTFRATRYTGMFMMSW